jgi:MFS family permease
VIAVLGVPTFGLALTTTVVTTYLPVVAKQFTGSTTVVGLIIGSEGLMAMWLPLLAGTWSDQLTTRLGGRLPFVLAGTIPLALALALLGFARSLPVLTALVVVFFFGYFVAYEPYRALYPDLVPKQAAGRSQAGQALWRGAGTGLALVGGGLLFAIAHWVPFIVAAAIYTAAIAAFTWRMLGHHGAPDQQRHRGVGLKQGLGELRGLIAEHPALRAYMAANALWELSLGALKTFVVLFLTEGLGKSLSTSSVIIGVAAIFILIAAPVSGSLADRFGRLPVFGVTLWFYGLGLLVPTFTQNPAVVLPLLPLLAFGGAVIMTLPYALLMPLMPAKAHGALTGFYSLSRGIGTMLGPLCAGAAIQLLRTPLSSTHGYAAMWAVCGGSALLSIPFLRWMRASQADRRNLRAEAQSAGA